MITTPSVKLLDIHSSWSLRDISYEVSKVSKTSKTFIYHLAIIMLCQLMIWFQGRVVMGTQAVSPYQQVIEKTKNLAFRSQMLVMNIEKKLATKDQEVVIHCYSRALDDIDSLKTLVCWTLSYCMHLCGPPKEAALSIALCLSIRPPCQQPCSLWEPSPSHPMLV